MGAFRFEHEHEPGVFVHNPELPLGAVAFTFELFVGLLAQAGLYVDWVLYGNWPGRPFHMSGHDIVVIRSIPGG